MAAVTQLELYSSTGDIPVVGFLVATCALIVVGASASNTHLHSVHATGNPRMTALKKKKKKKISAGVAHKSSHTCW